MASNQINPAILDAIVNELVSSDSSDSSSEEESLLLDDNNIVAIRRRARKPRIEGYCEMLVPLLSNADFKSHFRMTRTTFQALLNVLGPKLAPLMILRDRLKVGRRRIEPDKQLMIAIWKLATPDSYRSVCERFDIGKSTGLYIVRRVIKALMSIRSSIIKWPTDEEALETSTFYQRKYGFPGVIGMIDGTHIKIDAPHDDPEAYINRKGYHSIQLQVVCQQNLQFIDCFAGYPGSVHDSRVFQLSGMQAICNTERYFPNNTHLLGDAAYANQKHLLVPFKNNGRFTEREENYNTRLSSARMTVERSIGLLKGRFRILLDRLPVRRTDLIPNYIMACCVLHNFCLSNKDYIEIPLLLRNDIENVDEHIAINVNLRNEGTIKRNMIRDNLP